MNLKKALEILDLNDNSSSEEIKSAYRNMLKVWHPDRFQNDKELNKKAVRKTQEIIDAYDIINGNYKPKKKPKKESQTQYQPTDLQTDLRYNLHKNYQNTKKMTIKAEGDFWESRILERFTIFKNIHCEDIIALGNKDSVVCLFNNAGLISEIQSSKKVNVKISYDDSNNFLPFQIIFTENGELKKEVQILNKNEIINKILDYNQPSGYDKVHNLVHYFACSKDPEQSKKGNNFYYLRGYDIFDNLIYDWEYFNDKPNPFGDNIINNNYECGGGFNIYKYDKKGRITRKSSPLQIDKQQNLKYGLSSNSKDEGGLLDMMIMMSCYDWEYVYEENGNFIMKGINYYWESDKKNITTVKFQNGSPTHLSNRRSNEETIEKATYDNKGRLIQINKSELKHPSLLKFKKPKIENSYNIYFSYK